MDSVSYVDKYNHKDIIASGSHGKTSSAGYGLNVKVGAAFLMTPVSAKTGPAYPALTCFRLQASLQLLLIKNQHDN